MDFMGTKILINKVLHLFEVMRIKTSEKVVYLTFDDGPEGGITDFVLEELKKFEAKATFFCKGENAETNFEQFNRLISEGHSIGNHTYSHINSFNTKSSLYVDDVRRADHILHSHLFRPPWGSLRLGAFLRLFMKYKIVYWSLMSGDTEMDKMNISMTMERLRRNTRKGDVVLFHSCNLHANETRQILPLYLDWLCNNGYKCISL